MNLSHIYIIELELEVDGLVISESPAVSDK